MTAADSPRLYPERESVRAIRSCFDRTGLDLSHEMLRADYLTSPFPDRAALLPQLGRLSPELQLLWHLFSFGEHIPADSIDTILGRDLLESALATGLLVFDDDQQRVSTKGLQIVSRFGQYFVVSTSRAYPSFDPDYADIYLGPESYTFANYLQRRASSVAAGGFALDLCTGSGIAAQSLAALRRGLVWTGVDLSTNAVEAATFDAMLNDVEGRYTALEGDLYAPVTGQFFQLIIANPPFIPTPSTVDFPVYGDGGEDGLDVLRPMLTGLPRYLAPSGSAIIYAEGLGNHRGPFVLDLLGELAAQKMTVGLTLLSTMTIAQTLFSIGRMLAVQQPPRLDELVKWQNLFESLGATRYDKYIIEVHWGEPAVVIRSLDDLANLV